MLKVPHAKNNLLPGTAMASKKSYRYAMQPLSFMILQFRHYCWENSKGYSLDRKDENCH